MKLAIHWMFLGILAVTSFAAMAKSDAGIFEYQLKNGLKVVIKPDHRAPVVVQQVWYRVGSNYEENGLTGISHMLEHMMFKGTKTLKPGEFSEKVAKLGGQENAFTSSDYTVYYQVVGKQHLAEVMKLEADRMRNLVIKNKNSKKSERLLLKRDAGESKTSQQVNSMSNLMQSLSLIVHLITRLLGG